MEGKLVALFIGLAIALVGLGLATFGQPLIVILNRLYTAMPGRFQYPVGGTDSWELCSWWSGC